MNRRELLKGATAGAITLALPSLASPAKAITVSPSVPRCVCVTDGTTNWNYYRAIAGSKELPNCRRIDVDRFYADVMVTSNRGAACMVDIGRPLCYLLTFRIWRKDLRIIAADKWKSWPRWNETNIERAFFHRLPLGQIRPDQSLYTLARDIESTVYDPSKPDGFSSIVIDHHRSELRITNRWPNEPIPNGI